MQRIKRILPYVSIIFLIIALWIIRVYLLWNYTKIDDLVAEKVIHEVIRFIIWVLPPALFILFIERNKKILKALYITTKIQVKPAILLTIAACAYIIFGFVVQLVVSHTTPYFKPIDSIPYILLQLIAAPLIEEITFRGFLLPRLAKEYPFWIANAIQAVLFAMMHIPGWLFFDGLGWGMLYQFAMIFVLGYIMGVVAYKSKSILPSTFVHIFNNALAIHLFVFR